jgi:hypothetical protein
MAACLAYVVGCTARPGLDYLLLLKLLLSVEDGYEEEVRIRPTLPAA